MLSFAEGALNVQAWRKFCQFLLSSDTRKLTVDIVHNLIYRPHVASNHYHGLYFINFGHHVLILGQQGRELVSLIQVYTQDLWNLLDKRLLKPKRHHSSWPASWPISYSCWVSSVPCRPCGGCPQLWPHHNVPQNTYFLNQIVDVTIALLLDCMNCLYILDINPLPHTILAKIFSHSSGFFFFNWWVFFFFFCCAEAFFFFFLKFNLI